MRKVFPIVFVIVIALSLAACAASTDSGPVRAVEDYFSALAAKDADRLAALSCGDWESDALLALDSFQAVDTRLEGLACEQTGTDGNTALVLCNGSLVATYGDEDQQMDLSVFTYQVVQEGGEWLVCGTR